MYVVRDSVGPTIAKHVQAQRFKNTILRHWPKTTHADGTTTFNRLYTWTSGGGTQRSASHLKIYKIIGIEVTDIDSQDKKGLTAMYLDVSDLSREIVVGTDDITRYIEQFTPRVYPTGVDPFNSNLNGEVVPTTTPITYTDLNPDPYKDGDVLDPNGVPYAPLWDKDGWITSYLEYKPLSTALIDPNITDAGILAKCSGYNPTEVSFADGVFNRLTGIAMMDANGVLFERQLRVIQRTVEERHHYVRGNTDSANTSRYMVGAKVEFKFRRIKDASDISVVPLITLIEDKIADLNIVQQGPFNTQFLSLFASGYANPELSINKQLIRMANYITPYSSDGLNYSVEVAGVNSYIATNPVVRIKYDAISALLPQKFTKAFSSRIRPGYDVKPAEWWEIAIVVVLVIIIIIIAVIVAIPTGGGSIGWASASIVLIVGSLVMTGLAMYWAENGSPMAAQYAGIAAEYLGYAAMITGVAGATQSLIAQQGTMTVLQGFQAAGSFIAVGGEIAQQAGWVDEETAQIIKIVGAVLTVSKLFTAQPVPVAKGSVPKGATPPIDVPPVALPPLPPIDVPTFGLIHLANVPTPMIINSLLSFTNSLFTTYITVIAPPAEGIEAQEDKLRAQEKELETLNPENSEAIWNSYTDPYGSIFEVGDIYEKSYIMLTSGRNRLLMDKHYVSGY
mgnify:CR=1 FL=1